MTRFILLRRMIAVILTLSACLISGSSHKLLAQGGDVQVFKSGGGDRTPTGRAPPAPTALNELDVKKIAGMVGSTPGSVYAKLTPSNPSAANRGALVFASPKVVEGGENYATFGPPNPIGSVSLWLRPASGKKYLIDCAVAGLSASSVTFFLVTGPGGTAPMKVGITGSGQHLTFVLDATNNNWQQFEISGLGPMGSAGPTRIGWTFYSCEVTNL